MKSVWYGTIFLFSNFLMAQTGTNVKKIVTPPEVVVAAFEKEYPNKVPVWSSEYVSDDKDQVRYEAKFNTNKSKKALAVYDNLGSLKALELEISLQQLPKSAIQYLKTSYPAGVIKELAVVEDDKEKKTYEVGVTIDSKFYDFVFDKNGNFLEKVQKN